MITLKKSTKAQATEQKGDRFFQKGKFKKALQSYRMVQKENPDYLPVYDKLIETHQKTKEEWTDGDFSESLFWTMKKQELENPGLKRLHARLEPEWIEISKLIQQMMQAGDENEETALVEKIVGHGTKALYPLIEFLLSFKKLGRKTKC